MLTDRTHKDLRVPASDVAKSEGCFRLKIHSLSFRLYSPGLRENERYSNGFTDPYGDQRQLVTWPDFLLSFPEPLPFR